MRRRLQKTFCIEVYSDIRQAQLRHWLVFILVFFITMPNLLGSLVATNWINLSIAVFGMLVLINTVMNLLALRRKKKALLADPSIKEKYAATEKGTPSKPLHWFNKFFD